VKKLLLLPCQISFALPQAMVTFNTPQL